MTAVHDKTNDGNVGARPSNSFEIKGYPMPDIHSEQGWHDHLKKFKTYWIGPIAADLRDLGPLEIPTLHFRSPEWYTKYLGPQVDVDEAYAAYVYQRSTATVITLRFFVHQKARLLIADGIPRRVSLEDTNGESPITKLRKMRQRRLLFLYRANVGHNVTFHGLGREKRTYNIVCCHYDEEGIQLELEDMDETFGCWPTNLVTLTEQDLFHACGEYSRPVFACSYSPECQACRTVLERKAPQAHYMEVMGKS